jgi:hypothetical protein
MTCTEAKNIGFHRTVLVFCTIAVLNACGGDGEGGASQSATDDAGMTDEEIAAYQEKVSRKVSQKVGGAMVNALVEEWGISRDQAECLLSDTGATELAQVNVGDPKVLAVFNDCGVDPAVVK